MTFEEFFKTTSRTGVSLGDNKADTMHYLLGMITEVAEIADLYKKDMAYGKGIDHKRLEDEMGDLNWYMTRFMDATKLDPSRVFQCNFDKLLIRYPEGFKSELAINPDKQKEATVFNE